MKRFWILVLAFTFFGAVQASDEVSGKVVKVVDGNTFHLEIEEDEYLVVKLCGVDAPEIAQAYGEDALAFASQALLNKKVTVTITSRDRLGNYLGVVRIGKKKILNELLLEEGLGWRMEQCSDYPDWDQIMETSKIQGKGLWSQESPTPPWEYRRNATMLGSKGS